MDKKYRKIKFAPGDSLEKAIQQLLNYKKEGKIVYGIFNGFKLYSDTVTLDNAFKEILGKTYSEFYLEKEKNQKERKQLEQEFQKDLPMLIKNWKQQGREILGENQWEDWDRTVLNGANGLYHGKELNDSLAVIKQLNNNASFEETKKLIEDQNHSGLSHGLVCHIVEKFCERGRDFVSFME